MHRYTPPTRGPKQTTCSKCSLRTFDGFQLLVCAFQGHSLTSLVAVVICCDLLL